LIYENSRSSSISKNKIPRFLELELDLDLQVQLDGGRSGEPQFVWQSQTTKVVFSCFGLLVGLWQYTRVSIEPTQQISNIFNKSAAYPNGTCIQNSSSFKGFRM
jgi:hypothetical protein